MPIVVILVCNLLRTSTRTKKIPGARGVGALLREVAARSPDRTRGMKIIGELPFVNTLPSLIFPNTYISKPRTTKIIFKKCCPDQMSQDTNDCEQESRVEKMCQQYKNIGEKHDKSIVPNIENEEIQLT